MLTLDVNDLSRSDPGAHRLEKEALLRPDCIAHRLESVYNNDPDWTLALLRRHAGTLQELQLGVLTWPLLLQLARTPGLRKLQVSFSDDSLKCISLSSLPEHWDCQLRSLKVYQIPQRLFEHLLHAHRHSLEVLETVAGTGPKTGRRQVWPIFISDLPPVFDCGLQRLRHLSLIRHRPGCDPRCYAQLHAIRAILPRCVVLCHACMEGGFY